jgi:hypothetical protein
VTLDGKLIQAKIINTHLQSVILFFYKQDCGTIWKFGMSNEPLEIFINIFSKHCEFILRQVMDGVPNGGSAFVSKPIM